MKRYLIAFFITILFVVGCKKEENTPPTIDIKMPGSGEQYTQGDTIFYKFSVADDEMVTSIKVSINNNANQVVLFHNYINAGKFKEYEGFFLTESIAIIGATHHFVVSVTDGKDETKLARQLTIYQSERMTVGLFVATASSLSSYEISFIDTLYNQTPVMPTTGDFLNLEVSSADQMIYHSGKFIGDIFAKQVNGGMAWNEPANSVAGNPSFHNIALYDNILFVSYDNEIIKGFDKNKSVKFSANPGTGNYVVKLVKNENIILTEEYSYPYIETRLTSYYFTSGASIKTTSIGQMKLVDIFVKNNDEYVVVGNDNGNGKILYYNFPANASWQPYQIPTGDSVVAATHIKTDNSILIQLVSGLYKFNLTNNTFFPILLGSSFEVVKYNELDNLIISGSGTTLNYYSYPQMQLIHSLNTANPIKDMEILYNR